MESRITDIQAAQAEPLGEGEEMRVVWAHHGAHASTAVVRIDPGGGMKAHLHREHDEVMTVIQGDVQFRLGDGTRRLGPGEIASVSAGTVHGPLSTEGGCLLVSVFAGPFDPDNPDREYVD